MQAALAEGVFPGAVVLVRLQGRVVYHRAFGLAARLPVPAPASVQTLYDLASLTKPLATATALVCLAQENRLDLDTPLQEWLHELEGCPVGRATVGHALSHRTGLPAWRPYYEQIGDRSRGEPGAAVGERAERAALRLIREESLESEIGTHCRYSDLGYMLLGFLIARVSGRSLGQFCHERIYVPLGATELFFLQPDGVSAAGNSTAGIDIGRFAATEDDPWRERMVRGEVHDENAYALGGVSGHSGLFGTAAAVGQVSGSWLNAYRGRDSLLSSAWVKKFVTGPTRVAGCSWVYGWDTPSFPSSSGTHFSASSFGHLGFTGTSLWIDPLADLEVILLSNRVHPARANEAIRSFRPRIHDVIYGEFVSGR